MSDTWEDSSHMGGLITHGRTHHTWERVGDRPMVVTQDFAGPATAAQVSLSSTLDQETSLSYLNCSSNHKVMMKENVMRRQKQRDIWRCRWI